MRLRFRTQNDPNILQSLPLHLFVTFTFKIRIRKRQLFSKKKVHFAQRAEWKSDSWTGADLGLRRPWVLRFVGVPPNFKEEFLSVSKCLHLYITFAVYSSVWKFSINKIKNWLVKWKFHIFIPISCWIPPWNLISKVNSTTLMSHWYFKLKRKLFEFIPLDYYFQ